MPKNTMSSILVTFIAKDKNDESSLTYSAFEKSRQEYNLHPKYISVNDSLKIDKSKLSKTDVFVLEEFSGPAFEHLINCKALVIGTRCLLKCLSQSKPLPPWSHPIYSLAMEGMVITSSGIKANERDKIQQYVEWMGGIYDKALNTETTHLIANNVKSEKYSKAAGKIPILHREWIEAIWEATNQDTVFGDCSEFLKNSLQSYKLKPFHGLNITSANLSKDDKEKVKNCVESNGGVFMGNFKSNLTDLIVTTQSGVTSAKYKAARAAGKECVTPQWILDSGSAGYAKCMDEYRIGARSSTPTKLDGAATLEKDFSMMSVLSVSHNQTALSSVNESMSVTAMNSFAVFTKPTCFENETVTPVLKSGIQNLFDMTEIGNAGLFLRGCGIYLSGFSIEDSEFLTRILTSGGATRYDEPSEKVSHVIVAKPDQPDMQLFKEKGFVAFFVSVEWIAQCAKLKQIALEDDYIVKIEKNSIKPGRKQMCSEHFMELDETGSPRTERLAEIERSNLLEMYRNNASKSTTDTTGNTMQYTADESTIKTYLYGVKFVLIDLDEENQRELEILIKDAGGFVVISVPIADYIIAPELCSREISANGTCELVSPLFIRDCIENQERVPVQYYHRPIMESEKKPLTGLVFTISSYTGLERYFIGELSKELGARFVESMVRRNNPEKNLVATTHLICKHPEGVKYNACIRWGLPGVSSDWLLECARTGKRVLEQDYLVGDTKCPERSIINEEDNNDCSTVTGNDMTLEGPVPEHINQNGTPKSRPRTNLKLVTSVSADDKLSEENDKNVPNVSGIRTPIMNKHLTSAEKSPCLSQSTPPPLHKVLEKLRGKENTPESPGLPPLPEWLRTPDTPYGAFLWGPNPTPETRKRWKRFCDGLPSPETPVTPRTPSPTWSDVKRDAWALLLKPKVTSKVKLNFDNEDSKTENVEPQVSPRSPETTNEPQKSPFGVNKQVQKLNELLTSGLGGNTSSSRTLTPTSRKHSKHNIDTISFDREIKGSQIESVGWRDPSELESVKESLVTDSGLEIIQPFRKRPPRFLLSGVLAKDEIIESIETLGGEFCDGGQYDPTCSHILSDSITRTEKILCGLASGKWILSTDYLTHCLGEGRFIEEEPYEWGNPDSLVKSDVCNEYTEACYRMRCLYNNKPVENKTEGAFTGWKVLLLTERKASIERVIGAGFGEVVNCENIKSLQEGAVTHCICDPRRKILSTDETRHLIRIGVQVLPIQYLNIYLTSNPPPDPKEHFITV